MTPKQVRGKWLFLVLASLLILEKLVGVGFTLTGDLANVKWFKSVAQPIFISIGLAYLWYGDIWVRWLIGAAVALSGGLVVFVCARVLIKLANVTPPRLTDFFIQTVGYPVGIVATIGALHLIAGLLLLFSPSIRAFFRYQRGEPNVTIEYI